MKKKTRFLFTLPVETYELLKEEAENRNLSMSLYIYQALVVKLKEDRKWKKNK